jgi:hypothetical protein
MTMQSAAPSLSDLRADAARRNATLDPRAYYTVRQLAERWQLSATYVRTIPRDELPYLEFGRGLKLHRRRYPHAAVEAYEVRRLGVVVGVVGVVGVEAAP